MAHLTRKSYSTVKQQLQTSAGYSPLLLSEMDTIFMATYAAGNIINGKLGDTFNPTTILAIGLFGSGACLLLMTLLVLLGGDHYSEMLGNVCILVIYFLFGFFQATGGPVGTAVMGNWFCDPASIKARGTIFGFWTCHQYMGDISAALVTAWVLGIGCPYWYALFIPAVCNVAWAFLTMRLVADPYDMGIVTPEVRIRLQKNEAKHKEMAEKGQADYEIDDGPTPITYLAALQIPMVAQYAVAFGFFKLTNYVLFFWLPYFLGKAFDPVTANLIASLYSVGMMPGGIIVGYVRIILLSLLMSCAAAAAPCCHDRLSHLVPLFFFSLV
jgi:sugar phosphate permease